MTHPAQDALASLEIWKDVLGFEGVYQVSSFGRMKSLPKKYRPDERILRPCINSRGYIVIKLSNKGYNCSRKVHRVVMEAFRGVSDLDVNHIDGNKINNHLDNLEYISRRENVNHFYRGTGSCLTGVEKYYAKYNSAISVNGVRRFLGCFNTEIEAHNAYLAEITKLGETKYVDLPTPPKQGA